MRGTLPTPQHPVHCRSDGQSECLRRLRAARGDGLLPEMLAWKTGVAAAGLDALAEPRALAQGVGPDPQVDPVRVVGAALAAGADPDHAAHGALPGCGPHRGGAGD